MNIDEIVSSYFLEDKTYREIGNGYGISKQAVHAYVNRNKKEFKKSANKLFPTIQKQDMPLFKKIKMKRKLVGLSQGQIGEQLGTSKQYICNIEKGLVKSGKYVEMMCDLLEII